MGFTYLTGKQIPNIKELKNSILYFDASLSLMYVAFMLTYLHKINYITLNFVYLNETNLKMP